MKKVFLFILIAVFTASMGYTQTVNKVTRGTVTFKIKNLGINTGGSLGGVQATVQFNPDQLASSSIEATVDAATINTDNEQRDEHLKSDAFFDIQRYPKITMRSVSFKKKSGNSFTGKFNLTLKGKTRQVDIPFTYTDSGSAISLTGTFKLNRLDYGLGGNSLVLSDEATVTIQVELAK